MSDCEMAQHLLSLSFSYFLFLSVISLSDQLQAGEIHLIETSPEQKKAAKARLDTHRKKTPGKIQKKIAGHKFPVSYFLLLEFRYKD